VSKTVVNEYFDNLETSLSGITPQNIINYDETNFVDDPGRKKILVRKIFKHADNIMDSTKSATSVIVSVDAADSMLSLYVVYKSTQNSYKKVCFKVISKEKRVNYYKKI